MDPFQPILANALTFAFEKATIEGKITISALILVSMVSWSVIITKGRQILKARAMSKKFLAAYRDAKDPMSIFREKQEFSGAPAFEVYAMGCGEVEYHLENNPVTVKGQTYNGMMPPVGGLTDKDIADVVTFVNNSWGNAGPTVTEDEVAAIKKKYADRKTPWTAAEYEKEAPEAPAKK